MRLELTCLLVSFSDVYAGVSATGVKLAEKNNKKITHKRTGFPGRRKQLLKMWFQSELDKPTLCRIVNSEKLSFRKTQTHRVFSLK